MFDLRELKLMFLDTTDLIINNINKYLYSNKAIKFIFSKEIIFLFLPFVSPPFYFLFFYLIVILY